MRVCAKNGCRSRLQMLNLFSNVEYMYKRQVFLQMSPPVMRIVQNLVEFAVGKLDVKQRVLEGNDLLSPLAVQGDGNLGHSIFSSSVSRG